MTAMAYSNQQDLNMSWLTLGFEGWKERVKRTSTETGAELPEDSLETEKVSLKKDQAIRPQGFISPLLGSAGLALPLTYCWGEQELEVPPLPPSCLSSILLTYLPCNQAHEQQ